MIPAALFFLGVQQVVVTLDLGKTMSEGMRVRAEITRYDRTDRKDVTNAELDLRVPLPDGSILEKKHLALPYTIAHRVEDVDSVDVFLLPGSSQEVVIAEIAATQRRIAFYNVAMILIALVMAVAGVYYWNRLQKRQASGEGA